MWQGREGLPPAWGRHRGELGRGRLHKRNHSVRLCGTVHRVAVDVETSVASLVML